MQPHTRSTAVPVVPPLRRLGRCLLLIGVLAGLSGCARQIKWYPDYPQAERVAQQTHQPMLLYFWDWLSRDRARMEMGVFTEPQVVAAMQRTINVRLEAGWFRDLARQYDVRDTPTFVLTDASGAEQARFVGVPTPPQFVEWLQTALNPRGSTTRPAGASVLPPATQPAESSVPAPSTQPAP